MPKSEHGRDIHLALSYLDSPTLRQASSVRISSGGFPIEMYMPANTDTSTKATRKATQPQASSEQEPAALPATAPKPDSLRETIESIVVAFILAFVFRAFVVEAFIIPTGSMAPSLYGQHASHRCVVCQYPFDYGIRAPNAVATKGTLGGTIRLRCPNCGWSGKGNSNLNNALNPIVADSGDRILVLKWPYDIGGSFLGPKRWDVVVFKDPKDGDTNFIKRLLGLPGEVLQIVNGDVYTAPREDVSEDIRQALGKPPEPGKPNTRRLDEEQLENLAKVLKIQRKTPTAQSSLWMLHYDHDFMPIQEAASAYEYADIMPAWRCNGLAIGGGWDATSPCVRFEPPDEKPHVLQLHGKPIQDVYGYNDVGPDNYPLPTSVQDVGDVLLRFVLFPRGTEGLIKLSLTKGQDEFLATIKADGTVELERTGKGGLPIHLARGKIDPLHMETPLTIEFENLDYRVSLRINGEQVVATTDSQYAPAIMQLLADRRAGDRSYGQVDKPMRSPSRAYISISSQSLALEIRHLTVHRDVYYRSDFTLQPGNKLTRKMNKDYANYPGWGTEGNPLLLRDDPPDYFCCGDNSPASMDSRLWWEVCPMLQQRTGHNAYQYGTVPGDQMIGKAFFVYWPGGLRLSKRTPAIIPNFGRMRIIR